MSKTQETKTTTESNRVKPELIPADLGGGDIQYIKRGDYAKRTADTYALKWKAEITRAQVIMMLDALDGGSREMTEDTPPELLKLFKIVMDDYDSAVQEVSRKEAEEKAAKEKAEKDAKEKAEKEEKLIVAVQDKSLNLASLSEKFDTGNMDRFIPKGDVSNEEILAAFNSSMSIGEFSGWMQGDLIVELEKRGLSNVAQRLAEKVGKSYSHLYSNARTAKQFPPETRKKGVSFTVYREVGSTKFTDEQQKKNVPALVEEIAAGKHTTQTVREAVQKIKGKTEAATTLPEESDKDEFILIDPGLQDDPLQFVTIAKGFPKELVGGGLTIIHRKTGKRFTSMSKKPENRWDELPVYAKPEPEKKEDTKATLPNQFKKGKGKGKGKK